jgi:hypothetical protein
MPNCFGLTRKSDLNAGPVSLQEMHNEMREHFKQPPDPDHWLYDWYNTIGLALACGAKFDAIINDCHTAINDYPETKSYYETKLKMAEYLNGNFVSDA